LQIVMIFTLINPYLMNALIFVLFMENSMIIGYKIHLERIGMILLVLVLPSKLMKKRSFALMVL
jgi:hypothetical protein